MVKHYRKEDEHSYTLGTTLTIELLKTTPDKVVAVYYHSALRDLSTISDLCKRYNVPLIQSDKAFNILSQKENCFVIGEFVKSQHQLDAKSNHVVLVNPSNAGNLGTILRSMAGFGVHDLAIISPAVDIYDPKTVRSSMGALFHVRFQYYDNWSDYAKDAGERAYYPFMLKAKSTLKALCPAFPCSLVFGNEASGLPDEYLDIGTPIIIRHTDNIDSLNLPIAASIALYQLFSE